MFPFRGLASARFSIFPSSQPPLCAAALKIQTQSASNCNSSRFDVGAGKMTQKFYHCFII
jgi:hypothetical protein